MKEEILKYILKDDGSLNTGRCLETHLDKKGYSEYIRNLYDDAETFKECVYRMIHDIKIRPVCKSCGKHVKFHRTNGFNTFCSHTCKNNDPDVLERNKKNVSIALKKAYDERGDEICLKRSYTMMQKYGYKHTFEVPEIKEKCINTYIKNKQLNKHNNRNGGNVSRQRSVELQKHNGYDILYDKSGYVTVRNGCETCGDITIPVGVFNNRSKPDRIGSLCLNCNPLNLFSSLEKFVLNILDEYNICYETNKRKYLTSGKEIDIYIPSHKIGIECNGVYYHSEAGGKDKMYHINKTIDALNNNITLIHLWEDEIIKNPGIIRSMILNKLGLTSNKIYARQCDVKEINSSEYSEFLSSNHIQGHVNSKIKIGLYYKNELISVMGLGSYRIALGSHAADNKYELLRYAVKCNYNIPGGASKLFKYFIKRYNPEEVISYARRDYSTGNLYKMLGFTFVSYTQPNYFWVVGNKRINRFKYRKSNIVTPETEHLTEVEIMHNNGYFRIWDCGSIKFVYRK